MFERGGPEVVARWTFTVVGAAKEPGPDGPSANGSSGAGADAEPAAPYTRRNIVILRSKMNPFLVLASNYRGGAAITAMLQPYDERQQWYREDHDHIFKLFNVASGAGLTTNVVNEADGEAGQPGDRRARRAAVRVRGR